MGRTGPYNEDRCRNMLQPQVGKAILLQKAEVVEDCLREVRSGQFVTCAMASFFSLGAGGGDGPTCLSCSIQWVTCNLW